MKRCLAVWFLCALAGGASAAIPSSTRWEANIAKFEAQDQKTPPAKGQVLFVGSSTIVGWNLKQCFPGLAALNRGFGGSITRDSTYYADRIILPYAPRIIVFYAGDNDIPAGVTPEGVRDDTRDLLDKIQPVLPHTLYLHLGIKPSIAREKIRPQQVLANALVKDMLSERENCVYIEDESVTVGPDGKLKPEVLKADGLHLNEAGYKLLSDLVRPYLDWNAEPRETSTRAFMSLR